MPFWRQVGSRIRLGSYLNVLGDNFGHNFRRKRVLRASWLVLAPSWDRLGAVLARLGAVLARLGAVLVPRGGSDLV